MLVEYNNNFYEIILLYIAMQILRYRAIYSTCNLNILFRYLKYYNIDIIVLSI